MDDKYFYEKESSSFLETLFEFHRSRGTPIPRFPVIGGKNIDLFKLYNTVTELGGMFGGVDTDRGSPYAISLFRL